MLLLNINRKPCMGSPMALSNLTLTEPQRSKSRSHQGFLHCPSDLSCNYHYHYTAVVFRVRNFNPFHSMGNHFNLKVILRKEQWMTDTDWYMYVPLDPITPPRTLDWQNSVKHIFAESFTAVAKYHWHGMTLISDWVSRSRLQWSYWRYYPFQSWASCLSRYPIHCLVPHDF